MTDDERRREFEEWVRDRHQWSLSRSGCDRDYYVTMNTQAAWITYQEFTAPGEERLISRTVDACNDSYEAGFAAARGQAVTRCGVKQRIAGGDFAIIPAELANEIRSLQPPAAALRPPRMKCACGGESRRSTDGDWLVCLSCDSTLGKAFPDVLHVEHRDPNFSGGERHAVVAVIGGEEVEMCSTCRALEATFAVDSIRAYVAEMERNRR